MKKNAILSICIIAITIVLASFMEWDAIGVEEDLYFSTDLTLKELARRNGVPAKEILHILSHEDMTAWDLPLDVPIKNLDIDAAKIEHALEHIMEEDRPIVNVLKYVLWAIWISLVLNVVLSLKNIKRFRIVILLLTVLVFGVLLGATPNPMESIVKLFKVFNNMEGDPKAVIVSFILFSLFSVVGSKMLCSWGCQLGTLQESIFNIPIFKKKYKFQLPFVVSLSIRLSLFILFLLLLFGVGVGIKNFVIYHHVNYFKIYNVHDLAVFALYSSPIFVLASLFIYRPFCQFICPFGLYSWLLENVAINKIKIIEDKCTKCQKCVEICPTQAMKGIYEKKRRYFLPDCWSCGACIEVCPTNAIKYGYNEELARDNKIRSG
ncbi:MAG TPA: 4Fe-4S binding protein [Thermoplasmata archaeon]|nr:4Fe-4S binding protein [Thermoplasmata archaeon]